MSLFATHTATHNLMKNVLLIAATVTIGSSGTQAFAQVYAQALGDDFVISGGGTAGKEAGGAVGGGSAGGVSGGKDAGKAPGTGVSASISWEELKDRCLHPEQFDVQRPPQNVKLQCSDTRVEFVPTPAGQIGISGSRAVVSSIFSDKFHVVAGGTEVPIQLKPATCLRYKEVEKVLTIEKPMTCNDILGLKGDLNEYCTSALDRARGSNPKLNQVRDTGRIIDTCGATISGGEAAGGGAGAGSNAGGGAGAGNGAGNSAGNAGSGA